MKQKYKLSHKCAAAMTVGAMTAASGPAFAGTAVQFKDMTDNIITASSGFQNLISLVSYLGGAGLAVAGIFKLKQHVDNPGQTPMKEGLVRLGCGGGFLALPFVTSAMQGSIANGDATKVTPDQLKFDAFAP